MTSKEGGEVAKLDLGGLNQNTSKLQFIWEQTNT